MTSAVHAETGELVEITGVHPVADMFPMLDAEDLASLVDSIRDRGLISPIVVDAKGLLLDGRNRRDACEQAGIKPACSVYMGDDPVGHILALNNSRRHISKGQRAMVAVKALLGTNSQPEIARAAGVSQPYVAKAALVLEHAAEHIDDVRLGDLVLDKAYKIARANKQRDQDETARAAEAKAALERRMTKLRNAHPDLADRVGRDDSYSLAAAEGDAKQRDEDREGQLRRATQRLESLVSAWEQMKTFPTHPDRAVLLERLNAHDRAAVLEIESTYLKGRS